MMQRKKSDEYSDGSDCTGNPVRDALRMSGDRDLYVFHHWLGRSFPPTVGLLLAGFISASS
jgi:hypothetical protein